MLPLHYGINRIKFSFYYSLKLKHWFLGIVFDKMKNKSLFSHIIGSADLDEFVFIMTTIKSKLNIVRMSWSFL